MKQMPTQQVCKDALAVVEDRMLQVARLIILSEFTGDAAELCERLNTLDNGRIVLEQMVARHGDISTI